MKIGAVITAAGESIRMGGVDKVFASLCGAMVIERVIATFHRCFLMDQIVVVLSERNLELGKELVDKKDWRKVSDVCVGGSRRQDSVLAGIKRLDHCDWVVIHDGARPLVTEELIERGLDAAMETGAAVAAVPVTDTIKVAGEGEFVHQTLPRQNLWAVQTPQVFRIDIVEEAYRQVEGEVTDDSSRVEQLGYSVRLYMGSYDNIKITTPDDLAIAEILWRKRALLQLTNRGV